MEQLPELNGFNPVRSHIRIGFSHVKDYDEKFTVLADDMIGQGFDGEKSRVLIFVSLRKQAEEAVLKLSEILKKRDVDYFDKIDFFHGGLDSAERDLRISNYKNKNGETLILICTKAFGMGMDIKNVHYVYHIDPSSNFEDFLQEVGRAGRDKQLLHSAGFSEENPIKTNCIIAKDDFLLAKDRQHRNQITWGDFIQVQTALIDYVAKYSEKVSDSATSFALPLDLLGQLTGFNEKKCNETFFRVVLYWLEKLHKIKLGTYVPTHLPLKIIEGEKKYSVVKEKSDLDLLKSLEVKLSGMRQENGCVMISLELLKKFFNLESSRDIWRLLFLAQKANLLRIEREICIEPTKSRKSELSKWYDNNLSPRIEAIFELSKLIMNAATYNEQKRFEGETVDEMAYAAINKFIIPSNIFWKEFVENKNIEISKEIIAQQLVSDFQDKRVKFVFKIIGFLPEVRQKAFFHAENETAFGRATQTVFNGYRRSEEWLNYLAGFKRDLYHLIKLVNNRYVNSSITKYNVVDLLIELNIEGKGEKYFFELLYIARSLGFLKNNSVGLEPMGIELFVLDKSIISNENLSQFEIDIQKEFEDSNRMKELRSLALECFSVDKYVPVSKKGIFIEQYFKCSSSNDLINLLEEYSGIEILKVFRKEALLEKIEKLNDEQKKVYSASKDENLQVDAGPGSGKTHTLILRIARLIQEEKINPEEILVLAYNRAVVVELRGRLEQLFRALGYAKLIRRLKVFTYYGFCKYVVDEQLDTTKFNKWIPRFLEIARTTPGNISEKTRNISYVFVDEFQDITASRLELLKEIADPSRVKICVIGDPNQSIYGYDRVNEGGMRSPESYYREFKKIYKPRVLNLSVNYRSFAGILENSNDLLQLNSDKFEMPMMTAINPSPENEKVCEIFDYFTERVSWKDQLVKLVDTFEKVGGEKPRYASIAVLFRSNQEVYWAFNEIRRLRFKDIEIRIQGDSINLLSTREFYNMLGLINSRKELVLPFNFMDELVQKKNELHRDRPNWEEYFLDVFLCIADEFKKEQDDSSTYRDLIEFITEMSLKSDGHFTKIYRNNLARVTGKKPSREIILSTMHKVKGIEYDAVLIPPSFSDFPQKIEKNSRGIIQPADWEDYVNEERRLYFVAYTRAKYKLVVIMWKRENFLYNQNPIPCEVLDPKDKEKIGVRFDDGIDKFTLYWGASDYGRNSFNFIRDNVKIGDEVLLKQVIRGERKFLEVFCKDFAVAQLSVSQAKRLSGKGNISGLVVSAVYVHTLEETKKSDEIARSKGVYNVGASDKRPFADQWNQESKDRGFIYLIDFSGYGKTMN